MLLKNIFYGDTLLLLEDYRHAFLLRVADNFNHEKLKHVCGKGTEGLSIMNVTSERVSTSASPVNM